MLPLIFESVKDRNIDHVITKITKDKAQYDLFSGHIQYSTIVVMPSIFISTGSVDKLKAPWEGIELNHNVI